MSRVSDVPPTTTGAKLSAAGFEKSPTDAPSKSNPSTKLSRLPPVIPKSNVQSVEVPACALELLQNLRVRLQI